MTLLHTYYIYCILHTQLSDHGRVCMPLGISNPVRRSWRVNLRFRILLGPSVSLVNMLATVCVLKAVAVVMAFHPHTQMASFTVISRPVILDPLPTWRDPAQMSKSHSPIAPQIRRAWWLLVTHCHGFMHQPWMMVQGALETSICPWNPAAPSSCYRSGRVRMTIESIPCRLWRVSWARVPLAAWRLAVAQSLPP